MKKLGFIGGGNMAEALMRGLVEGQVFTPADLIASDVDAARRRQIKRKLKIDATADNLEVVRNARAILFAVKPQNIDEVLREIATVFAPPAAKTTARSGKTPRSLAAKDRLFISIAAGITLGRFAAAFGAAARVVRVMPNAPAMVGQGMAAMVRAPGASKADEAFALRLFRAVGDAVALDDETLLDAVTALSGSGPAYVYLFVKALTDAGVAEGLPPALSLRMALKTVRGAEENMRQSPLDAAELIRIVASPGGTTEAALRKFAESGFSDIVSKALHAAAERSRDLGRN
ncbi:MAG TPA: pyrroline-5-carboxylate reductase [Candidatus Binataceae bacterium]|nr:pyrroline-5-carboxylate reductase [Candidatus Binataceae bacterium]